MLILKLSHLCPTIHAQYITWMLTPERLRTTTNLAKRSRNVEKLTNEEVSLVSKDAI